jgi:putative transcriptional regulator
MTRFKVAFLLVRWLQAVLATALNMSSESVQKWEQGKTKPHGAALRLLNIIKKKGIASVI